MFLSLVQRLMALVSLLILAAAIYLIVSWRELYVSLQPPPGESVDTEVWRLWLGGALLAVSFLGRTPIAWLLARRGDDGDRFRRQAGEAQQTPNSAVLHVEADGPSDAPVLVFVHGWGLDASIWWEARRTLSRRYQVMVYDLAGLGKSKQPRDGRISLDRFAEDLAAVVARAGRRKVIVVGHSIGGMTVLTFCRRFPELLNRQVLGIVLENTTSDNPARTTALREALYSLRPVLRPLMWLDVALQPLVWLMNWQSYLSGSTHIAMRLGGFGVRPTRAQLEQAARLATRNPPAVQAKGNLAMMDWRIEDELPSIRVPALVFIGERDLVTIPEAGEQIVSRMSQARAVRIDEAGHLGPLEFAEDYNAAIERFADEIFTRGAQAADLRASGIDRARNTDPRRPGPSPDDPQPLH